MFGIPCYVRKFKFIESLISDVGVLLNGDKTVLNKERMDVTSVMIFTNPLGAISLKINACADGVSFLILVSEEPSVSMESTENTTSESDYSSFGSGEDVESEPQGEWEENEEAASEVGDRLSEKKETCSEGICRVVSSKDTNHQFFAKSTKFKSLNESEKLIEGSFCSHNQHGSSSIIHSLDNISRVACSIDEGGADQESGPALLKQKVGQHGIGEKADDVSDPIDEWTGPSLPGPRGKTIIGPSCTKLHFVAEEIKGKNSLLFKTRSGPQEQVVGLNQNSNIIIGKGPNEINCKNDPTTYSTCFSALDKSKGDLNFAFESSILGAPNQNMSF